MQIKDSRVISSQTPMFVDCNKFKMINGHIYDSDLVPVPFSYFGNFPTVSGWHGAGTISGVVASFHANTVSAKESVVYVPSTTRVVNFAISGTHIYEANQKRKLSLVDNLDDSITYNLSSTRGRYTNSLAKIQIDSNSGKVVESRSTSDFTAALPSFVGQSDTHVYMIGANLADRTICGTAYTSSITRIVVRGFDFVSVNKSTMVASRSLLHDTPFSLHVPITNIGASHNASRRSEVKVILEDESYIYVSFSFDYNSHSRVITRVNKVSNALEELRFDNFTRYVANTTTPSQEVIESYAQWFYTNTYHGIQVSTSDGIVNGDSLVFYSAELPTTAPQDQYFATLVKYEINRLTGETSKEIFTMTNIILSKIYPYDCILRCETTKINGNIYISYIPSQRDGETNLFEDDDCYITTFRVEEDFTLTETNRTKVNVSNAYVDIITRHDGSEIICPTHAHIDFYRFDSSIEGFTLSNSIFGYNREFFLDHQNRFWTKCVDNTLSLHHEHLASNSRVEFAESSYSYTGNSVDTFVRASTKNYLGEYVESTLIVKLGGHCAFNDGTKEARVTTLISGELEIPVIINGPGHVRVSCTVVTI